MVLMRPASRRVRRYCRFIPGGKSHDLRMTKIGGSVALVGWLGAGAFSCCDALATRVIFMASSQTVILKLKFTLTTIHISSTTIPQVVTEILHINSRSHQSPTHHSNNHHHHRPDRNRTQPAPRRRHTPATSQPPPIASPSDPS